MKKQFITFLIPVLMLMFSFTGKSKLVPEQFLTTQLSIIVRDELGNLAPGVKVRLFKSKEDYDKLENQATETLVTNDKGKVLFRDLEAIEYYINAEKNSANNFAGGEKTDKLESGRINKVTVVISE